MFIKEEVWYFRICSVKNRNRLPYYKLDLNDFNFITFYDPQLTKFVLVFIYFESIMLTEILLMNDYGVCTFDKFEIVVLCCKLNAMQLRLIMARSRKTGPGHYKKASYLLSPQFSFVLVVFYFKKMSDVRVSFKYEREHMNYFFEDERRSPKTSRLEHSERSDECIDFIMICVFFEVVSDEKIKIFGALFWSKFNFLRNMSKSQKFAKAIDKTQSIIIGKNFIFKQEKSYYDILNTTLDLFIFIIP
ncbi:hypothetical protein AGLY_006103 [Aphis glycines]|uniref:Uncharacterized protein n=1 Tax=Aphis glycines TaxID=307491 RepID=A0A6G0TST5_APHGL|nr:hypothetical protein AGLY_006103 [Aphis glycines]